MTERKIHINLEYFGNTLCGKTMEEIREPDGNYPVWFIEDRSWLKQSKYCQTCLLRIGGIPVAENRMLNLNSDIINLDGIQEINLSISQTCILVWMDGPGRAGFPSKRSYVELSLQEPGLILINGSETNLLQQMLNLAHAVESRIRPKDA